MKRTWIKLGRPAYAGSVYYGLEVQKSILEVLKVKTLKMVGRMD